MSYSLITLWHERRRYLPGILAVGFSALLIALQCGLLLGLFSITSIPIDHSKADLWIGSPQVLAVDLGRPIPTSLRSRIASIPRRAAAGTVYRRLFGLEQADRRVGFMSGDRLPTGR
ncbi:MAG: hypothetical protein KatS3mg105_1947 [Gemmatales bacterium]|nr:MAG: hypothetical protein KatS3mg105_1947 [Gemmatales bacterium]